MPVTATGLVYTTATVITQSQSITGSFVGCLALASGSNNGSGSLAPVDFTGLKDAAGNNIFPGTHMFLPPGTPLNINITSASLHSTSAPAMFFIY
jgi:hypothetical protein